MKKIFAIILITLLTFSLCACKTTETAVSTRYETERIAVEATCMTEGYIEHVYSDGYVMRDGFTERTPHDYVEFDYGSEKNVRRYICKHCGKQKTEIIAEKISTSVNVDESRERPSFAGLDVMACAMILEPTVDEAITSIRKAEANGAFGFMVYVSCLYPEERTTEKLKKIMYCTDKPILAIAYNNSTFFPQNLTYEDIAELLERSVIAGAAAVDMMGYLYDDYANNLASFTYYSDYWAQKGFSLSFLSAKPKEVCGNPLVLARQKELIDRIHSYGGEVLLSMHIYTQMTSDQIVDLVKYSAAQNVDIVKIVLTGSSKETVIEHLKACARLEELRKNGVIPCKFSVHGQSSLSRLMCPMFGSYIAFCVDNYTEVETNIQVDLDTMITILNSPELKGARQ